MGETKHRGDVMGINQVLDVYETAHGRSL